MTHTIPTQGEVAEALTPLLARQAELGDGIPFREIASLAGLAESEAERWIKVDAKTGQHWLLASAVVRCWLGRFDSNLVHPTDAPRPALGELARRANVVKQCMAAEDAYYRRSHDFSSVEAHALAGATASAKAMLASMCSADSILQLVALATGGAEAKLPWGCSRCGSELFTGEQKSGICGDCAALTPERPADV